MKIIFYPGTFNPFTKGHADILSRLLPIADKVVIGVGVNIEKPEAAANGEKNAEIIRSYVSEHDLSEKVEVAVYSGLTGEEAIKRGACCIARGVRNSIDFEYEYNLAAANRDAFGIDTILLPASLENGFISSTLIRDLEKHGRTDLTRKYLP